MENSIENTDIQEITEALKRKGVVVQSIILENDFVKVTRGDGYVRYYTQDGNHSTAWVKFIAMENDFVKVTRENGDIRYFTLNLKYYTNWVKFIVMENDFVKATREDGEVRYYTLNLKHHTEWGQYTSIAIKDGLVELETKSAISLNLEKIN